ncbi:MAG: FkbM family methyltransferase [Chitinophagales bacterium]|nr:FkbM family methyltransferase [Chitinophagales bacterium]
MIRHLIERLSRGKIITRRFSQNFDNRKLIVSPECGLRYWKFNLDNIDPMLTFAALNFINKDDVIWDIGANLGIFGFMATIKSNGGKCLMVEPDVWLSSIIQKSIDRNQDLDLNVLPIAISEKSGIASFNIANRSRATSHLSAVDGSTQTGGTRNTRFVPILTLDSILEYFEPPNFIKIDTEGAELMVIHGSIRVFEFKPDVLIEVYEKTYDQVLDFLVKRGYKLLNAEKFPSIEPLLPKDKTQNIFATIRHA